MKVHLIDGSGYIYRAFYAMPPLARKDGAAVGAVYGYCAMLKSLIQAGGYTHIAVIMDGGRSGRDTMDASYKANRSPRPPELISQLDIIPEATAAFGVASIRVHGFEADDVIATYARQISADGGEVVIYSGDKDMLPLLTIDGVSIYDPMKKQTVTESVCVERTGVQPTQVADWLALVGDSSDNIPGVPKIGAKTAASLLNVHGDLESILSLAEANPGLLACKPAQRQSISENIAAARLSRQLVELQMVDAIPDYANMTHAEPEPNRLLDYLRSMEFAVMANDFEFA